MFSKIEKTDYPAKLRPTLIWDGECGFCRFWVIHLKQHTQNKIVYNTYQEAAARFPDIPLKEFKKASRLIEVDGGVFSGPDSLYRSLQYFDSKNFSWHNWYRKYVWFCKISDHGYNFIAKNRPMMFTLTKAMFGDRPEKLKHYWLLFILVIIMLVFLVFG